MCVVCVVCRPAEILPSSWHFLASGHDQDWHPVSWCQLENDGPPTYGHPDQKISARFVVSLQLEKSVMASCLKTHAYWKLNSYRYPELYCWLKCFYDANDHCHLKLELSILSVLSFFMSLTTMFHDLGSNFFLL